ncbi:hypothetical protein [Curtobacterium sp. VKM Ac-2922]|uniref:hypothetical protein n=1 Tax=Curtobacterium sp. VKM Ac-2922 TaxID=2929475 RepID=UPI001FB1C3AA|nr:hypothetical protein [Curtobacterium sp. VKM Ac-2922]MCJ1714642.1 hypothetical protein [Curtobacterium sp. VKM Ac-2922]
MTSNRVLYSNVKPYAVPARLEDLHGPEHGLLELPVNVYWGPNPVVDLDTDDGVDKAYQSVIQEGRIEDLVAILNPNRLRSVWADLLIPGRARAAWENRFPALAASFRATPLTARQPSTRSRNGLRKRPPGSTSRASAANAASRG